MEPSRIGSCCARKLLRTPLVELLPAIFQGKDRGTWSSLGRGWCSNDFLWFQSSALACLSSSQWIDASVGPEREMTGTSTRGSELRGRGLRSVCRRGRCWLSGVPGVFECGFD